MSKFKFEKEFKLKIERLKSILEYNPNTGKFTRIITMCNNAIKGNIAGSINLQGYEVISIDGYQYKSHRLAFFYMNNLWPNQIDHINHIRNDNRWCNLREVDINGNNKNLSLSKANKTGVTGVFWYEKAKKYMASIRINKKSIHLGLFSDINDAVKARKNAELKYDFHCNHGYNRYNHDNFILSRIKQ